MNWYKMSQANIELWLDDERDPKNPQIQRDFGAKGTELWVKTVPEAIKHLSIDNVTFISFDNDLGTDLEGRDLAKWIEEKAYYKELPKLGWNVHSKNPVAAVEIQKAMSNADNYWNNPI